METDSMPVFLASGGSRSAEEMLELLRRILEQLEKISAELETISQNSENSATETVAVL